jgi:predicted nucleic acid-binding protein
VRHFFDTNVLVYSQDAREPGKREVARVMIGEAIGADAFVVSTQVLVEFYAVCVRRKLLGPGRALGLVQLWSEHDTVSQTPELVMRGLALHQAHSISMWDALIVQAALDARCDVLWSEDLQHGRRFGNLEVHDPFLGTGTHERPAAPYRAPRTRRRTVRQR